VFPGLAARGSTNRVFCGDTEKRTGTEGTYFSRRVKGSPVGYELALAPPDVTTPSFVPVRSVAQSQCKRAENTQALRTVQYDENPDVMHRMASASVM
jgi:hypothetical protein